MSWFSWSPAYYYQAATRKMDEWFAQVWKPTQDVKKIHIEALDIFLCGSEEAARRAFEETNGHPLGLPPGIGGFAAGRQLYLISAFTDKGIIVNPVTAGHELIEYLDGRYKDVIEADDYPKKETYA